MSKVKGGPASVIKAKPADTFEGLDAAFEYGSPPAADDFSPRGHPAGSIETPWLSDGRG